MLARLACVAKVSDLSNLKLLSPKEMLQRLPIALAQVKIGNSSENLLNGIRQIIYSLYREKETGIRQIIYSLYREKETAKKIYINIMNSIKL